MMSYKMITFMDFMIGIIDVIVGTVDICRGKTLLGILMYIFAIILFLLSFYFYQKSEFDD